MLPINLQWDRLATCLETAAECERAGAPVGMARGELIVLVLASRIVLLDIIRIVAKFIPSI